MSSHMRVVLVVLIALFFTGCSVKMRDLTVADIERKSSVKERVKADQKEDAEVDADIYQAYTAYVKESKKEDGFRAIAISRLADLELKPELDKVSAKDDVPDSDEADLKQDEINRARLERTMLLLEMSLRDYPDVGSNDEVLYRLAMISSQLTQSEKSASALEKLVENHPHSRFYLEAKFRLAEDAFVIGDYEGALNLYTEVINAVDNEVFFEKAYFKRGWSKFKLQEYRAAIDDLMVATAYRDSQQSSGKDRDEMKDGDEKIAEDEHFRAYFYAIALNFSYMEDSREMIDYFRKTRSSRFAYHAYAKLSDIYLAQKRYSDVVAILKQFVRQYPDSRYLPHMEFRVITTWERSGFFENFYNASDEFYKRYNPSAYYWKGKRRYIHAAISAVMKENILSLASYYHNQYQSTSEGDSLNKSFERASLWYERYLAHFSETALLDNVYNSYADLLTEEEQYEKAIGFYEKVAFSHGVIVDQRAAYATVVLAERLFSGAEGRKQITWRARYIKHALLFKRTYPRDERSERAVLRAAEMAFVGEQYLQAINITSLLESVHSKELRLEVNQIKAESYFNLAKYRRAESTYLYLIRSLSSGDARKKKMEDRLALTIYKQAEIARDKGDDAVARKKFERIAALAGESEIAPKGLYDALVSALDNESWLEVIDYGTRFRSQYPENERRDDVTKMLSVAYISEEQHANAAQILEEVYSIEQDKEIKMAVLWQSAELYESLDNKPAAIRTYQLYVETYPEPFPQYMEALNKLTTMNDSLGDTKRGDLWATKIRKADAKAEKVVKTDRTDHITALAKIRLAREKKALFDKLKIRQPLKVHLKRKKAAMDRARTLYTAAYEYHSPEIMTESLFSIAEMYFGFSQDVLNSSRPEGLNEDEMEQYEIGLEDLAFPVEEKAIEIYQSSLAQVNQDIFNGWSQKSMNRLRVIFPARYAREIKVDGYVDYTH